MRTKEYLVAVRVRDGALTLTTMRFHDEVRPTSRSRRRKKPAKQQVDQAVAIIEELSTDWDPERYEDCYRERLREVIESKRKRRKIEAPEPEREPQPVPDLMAALQRTLDNVRNGRDLRDAAEDGAATGTSAGSAATSSRSAQGRRRSRGVPRCPRRSWSRPSAGADGSAGAERPKPARGP